MSRQDFLDAGNTAANIAQCLRNGDMESAGRWAEQKLGLMGRSMLNLLMSVNAGHPEMVAQMLEKMAKIVEQSEEKFRKELKKKGIEATDAEMAAAEQAKMAAARAAAQAQARQELFENTLKDLRKDLTRLEKRKEEQAKERETLAKRRQKLQEKRRKAGKKTSKKKQQELDKEEAEIAQKERELRAREEQTEREIQQKNVEIAKTELEQRKAQLESMKQQQNGTQEVTSNQPVAQQPTVAREINPLLQQRTGRTS